MPNNTPVLSATETVAALRAWLSQSRHPIAHVHPVLGPVGEVDAVTVFTDDNVTATLDLPDTEEGRAISRGIASAWTVLPACIDLKTGQVTPSRTL